MNSIIGLMGSDAELSTAVELLRDARISEEYIQVISQPSAINRLFGCDPACVIKNYTFLGTALGIITYAFFGAAAALCQCNLLHFGKEYGAGALLGGLLAGTLVGGFLGLLFGAGVAEKDTQYYQQGIREGGKVISVLVKNDEIEIVREILARQHVMGFRILQPAGS